MSAIHLSNGKAFDLLFPQASVHGVTIEVIASSLSKLCRFTGHVSKFYSVAQHSVLVSRLVPPDLQRAALLHDAAEAFIGDASSPLKRLLPDYRLLEENIERVLFAHFGVAGELCPMHPAIKYADLLMLAAEKRDFLPEEVGGPDWDEVLGGIPAIVAPIIPYHHESAYGLFMERYKELTQ